MNENEFSRSVMIVQNVKLLVGIGIMKALSCHNGLMHINTQKMVWSDQHVFLQSYFIISLTILLLHIVLLILLSLCSGAYDA